MAGQQARAIENDVDNLELTDTVADYFYRAAQPGALDPHVASGCSLTKESHLSGRYASIEDGLPRAGARTTISMQLTPRLVDEKSLIERGARG